MASGLSRRHPDGVEDSRNPRQAIRQTWLKLIVKGAAYWHAQSAVYVNEPERERERSDIRRRLVRGMICSVS